jgi:hypothetical protein
MKSGLTLSLSRGLPRADARTGEASCFDMLSMRTF